MNSFFISQLEAIKESTYMIEKKKKKKKLFEINLSEVWLKVMYSYQQHKRRQQFLTKFYCGWWRNEYFIC